MKQKAEKQASNPATKGTVGYKTPDIRQLTITKATAMRKSITLRPVER